MSSSTSRSSYASDDIELSSYVDSESFDSEDSSDPNNSAIEAERIRRAQRERYFKLVGKRQPRSSKRSVYHEAFSKRIDYTKKWFHGIGSKIRNAEHDRHHPLTKMQIFRHRVGEFVEDHKVQSVLLFLLFLDIIVISFILAISLNAFGDPHHGSAHTAEQWLHWIGFGLLVIFLIEKALLLFSFGWLFFTHLGYVFDTIIVITAIVFKFVHEGDGTGLIIALRGWRVFMIVHSLYEEVHHYIEHIRAKLRRKVRYIRRQREYINYLESKLGITPGMGRIINESTNSDSTTTQSEELR